MKVQFQMSGGLAYFPGLAKPITIDPAQDAATLAAQVNAADFFNLPAQANAPTARSADARSYTITIDDGQRRHTVQVNEPITDPNLQALVDHLRLLAVQTVRNQADAPGSAEAAPDSGARSLDAPPAHPAPPPKKHRPPRKHTHPANGD
jgi:hypothetical protein